MNTIAHITAMVAVLHLAVYSFETLKIQPLGFVAIGLFGLFLVLTVSAIADDWDIMRGWSGRRRGD